MTLRVVELFAGVGGFRVGLNSIQNFDPETGLAIENGEWDFVWANQWEPGKTVQHAFDCYVKRFGEEEFHINQDIAKFKKSDIPNHELLVGGFPCQDYSVARSSSNEKGIKGVKGVLWWQILETLKAKRSPFILLENVDRLLKTPVTNRGRDFSIMLRSLANEGYITEWRVINAGEYGMPQKRRRVFIFAYKEDSSYGRTVLEQFNLDKQDYIINRTLLNSNFPTNIKGKIEKKDLSVYKDLVEITDKYPTSETKYNNTGIFINKVAYHCEIQTEPEELYTLRDIIRESNVGEIDYNDYKISNVTNWKAAKSGKSIPRVTPGGFEYQYAEGNMSFPDRLDVPGRTMLTSESTTNRSSHAVLLNKDEETYRTITEIEAERLNQFPANWTNTGMPKRMRYFTMGNALVTGILTRISEDLMEIVLEEQGGQ